MALPPKQSPTTAPDAEDLNELRARSELLEKRLEKLRLTLKLARENEERFRSMADFAFDWEYWLGEDGKFLYISPSCERITGYRTEEFEADPELLLRIVHPDDLGIWNEHSHLEGSGHESSVSVEFRIVTKQGEVRWIGHNCMAVRAADGSLRGRRSSNRDITRNKEREEKLLLLTRAVEQSPLSVVITDPKGDIEFVNPHFTALTGYSAEEVQGQNPRVLKSGRQPTSFYHEMWATITAGNEWYGEFCNLKKNGEEYWERASISPIKSPSGEITHYLAVKEDITERRRARESLRESEERYREVVENTSNIVTRVNAQGRYTFLNTAARRIFGPETDLGHFAFDNLHPEDRLPTKLAYGRWLRERPERVEFENRILDAEGGQHHIRWSISLRFDPSGGLLTATSIGHDFSEQQKLQQLREDVDRITRHDLKSPLLSMISVPQLLLSATNLDAEQRELIQAIEESGYRMLRLINLSLDLYKIETGVYRLRPRKVDLCLVLRRVLEETSRSFLYRRAAVLRDNEPENTPYPVFGEELLCHSLLSNLLRNALESTPENKVAEVRLLQGDPARIEIHNRLPVPEAVRNTFFEKYSTSGKLNGTGLGTYSAKLMTEVQGGSIAMRTSSEEGTLITIVLPRPPDWAR
ncbi:MAG: PAS domain S-box protein [Desulfovibrio sp.]